MKVKSWLTLEEASFKVSPEVGSRRLSMVVQPLPTGKRIGVHMHERDEEVFFVHRGKGTVILDDKRTPVEEGSVVFIPPGTWHGFEANDDMQLVWLISPPHFVEWRPYCRQLWLGQPSLRWFCWP
jgi:quercetin dioxygenase-like cupin family protein